MSEYWMVALMAFGGVAFALGGMQGGRILRRYGLPLGFGLALFLNNIEVWRCVGFTVVLSFALHLGYGEKSSWLKKALVFGLYVASTLFLGITIWQLIAHIIMLLLFMLSNSKYSNQFVWKICEFLYGVLIAITVIVAIGR